MANVAPKIYHLLPHTDSTVPIYRRVSDGQRVPLKKRIIDHPYLQITFNDQAKRVIDRQPNSDKYGKEIDNPRYGKNVTCRLKLTSNSIYQDEQIKEGIPANQPFTQSERDAVQFNHGVLVTANPIVQWFLETVPHMKGFKGLCDDIPQPLYEIYDPTIEVTDQNKEIRKRTAAVVKVLGMDLETAQNLMVRLNGSYVKTPDTLEEVQNQLVDFIDNAGDAELEELMKDEANSDQQITILLGRVIKAGILSFDQEPNHVSKKKGNGWVSVKMVSSDATIVERERLFTVFLGSPEGKLLLEDLKAELKKMKKGKKAKEVEQEEKEPEETNIE